MAVCVPNSVEKRLPGGGLLCKPVRVRVCALAQRATLEIVGCARQDGALRNQLCAAAKLVPKNFHYVMKVNAAAATGLA